MNDPSLLDTWTSVQRAETLLVRTAVQRNPALMSQLFTGVELDRAAQALLTRMASGFDPQNLRAGDYLVRYPFSSVETIESGLEHLVDCGVAVARGEGRYALSALGEQVVHHWLDTVSTMIQSLDLGDVPPAAIQSLLDYDRHILEAIQAASRPHGHPIFRHRLRGLHPAYDPPQRWHHWQRVWTMLAASEDEQEYVRQQRNLSPLVWFIRRQTWFVHRRPWLVRAKPTLENLVRRATGYSPIDHAEEACARAAAELEAHNWLETVAGEFRLTQAGLAACDQDESEIDANFLSCWPAFSGYERKELLDISTRLNSHLEALRRSEPESRSMAGEIAR